MCACWESPALPTPEPEAQRREAARRRWPSWEGAELRLELSPPGSEATTQLSGCPWLSGGLAWGPAPGLQPSLSQRSPLKCKGQPFTCTSELLTWPHGPWDFSPPQSPRRDHPGLSSSARRSPGPARLPGGRKAAGWHRPPTLCSGISAITLATQTLDTMASHRCSPATQVFVCLLSSLVSTFKNKEITCGNPVCLEKTNGLTCASWNPSCWHLGELDPSPGWKTLVPHGSHLPGPRRWPGTSPQRIHPCNPWGFSQRDGAASGGTVPCGDLRAFAGAARSARKALPPSSCDSHVAPGDFLSDHAAKVVLVFICCPVFRALAAT